MGDSRWPDCSFFSLPGAASNQTQMLDQDQAMAVESAVSRARFDMNCPAANGQVISRELVQPALQGPW